MHHFLDITYGELQGLQYKITASPSAPCWSEAEIPLPGALKPSGFCNVGDNYRVAGAINRPGYPTTISNRRYSAVDRKVDRR